MQLRNSPRKCPPTNQKIGISWISRICIFIYYFVPLKLGDSLKFPRFAFRDVYDRICILLNSRKIYSNLMIIARKGQHKNEFYPMSQFNVHIRILRNCQLSFGGRKRFMTISYANVYFSSTKVLREKKTVDLLRADSLGKNALVSIVAPQRKSILRIN